MTVPWNLCLRPRAQQLTEAAAQVPSTVTLPSLSFPPLQNGNGPTSSHRGGHSWVRCSGKRARGRLHDARSSPTSQSRRGQDDLLWWPPGSRLQMYAQVIVTTGRRPPCDSFNPQPLAPTPTCSSGPLTVPEIGLGLGSPGLPYRGSLPSGPLLAQYVPPSH